MTQEERWQKRYEEVIEFMEREYRKLSKYYPEEKLIFISFIITRSCITRN